MNVTATMTASGLDIAKRVVGARDNGILLSFTSLFIFNNTHQSIEDRPARVRATRREVADMWVMVKQAQGSSCLFAKRRIGFVVGGGDDGDRRTDGIRNS